MPSIRYLMVRSAKGASRTTHDVCAAPGFRSEANSFTCSQAGTHVVLDIDLCRYGRCMREGLSRLNVASPCQLRQAAASNT